MINAPETSFSSEIKCSICRSVIRDRHKIYQSSPKLGIICKTCRKKFSPDDVEMIVNIFFVYGGYFGQRAKIDFSLDDIVVEFARQLETGRSTFHAENVKMWHKVLVHGITPAEFLKELSLLAE